MTAASVGAAPCVGWAVVAHEFWGDTVPCAGRWALFDSTRADDHREAAAICATCPLARVGECRANLAAVKLAAIPDGGPVGTWGGLLVGEGAVARRRRLPYPREHGTDRGYGQHRYQGERACDECREAHRIKERDRVKAA